MMNFDVVQVGHLDTTFLVLFIESKEITSVFWTVLNFNIGVHVNI